MKQLCISMRPGTLLSYKSRTWKVATNDTLSQRITIRTLDEPWERKTFHYANGQELDIRWKPEARI